MFIYLASSNSLFPLLLSMNSGILTISTSLKYISKCIYIENVKKKFYLNSLPGRGIVQVDSDSVCSEIFGWGRIIGLVQRLAIAEGEKLFHGPKCGSDRAHI